MKIEIEITASPLTAAIDKLADSIGTSKTPALSEAKPVFSSVKAEKTYLKKEIEKLGVMPPLRGSVAKYRAALYHAQEQNTKKETNE